MKWSALLVLAALIGGAVYWTQFHEQAAPEGAKAGQAAPSGAPPGMPVEAVIAKGEALNREAIALGTLISNESVAVSSEIAGRIAKVGFKEGQAISAGTLLFQLDDRVLKAELHQARANLELARRNAERADELHSRKLASARERDEASANLALAEATLELAQARLQRASILAPFDGITGLRSVSPGDYVNPGQQLVNLESIDPLKVEFRLAEIALPALAVGQSLEVRVDAYPGESFAGEVYAIDPRLDVANRSIGVRAWVPNADGRLRPGLFAQVNLRFASKPDAILVPEQAIMPRGNEAFVYVIEDGKAAMRPVKTGLRRSGRVELVEGVAQGDTVITAGTQKIGPGSPVMAINLPKAEADAPAGG